MGGSGRIAFRSVAESVCIHHLQLRGPTVEGNKGLVGLAWPSSSGSSEDVDPMAGRRRHCASLERRRLIMRNSRRWIGVAMMIGLLLALVSGCSKVSKENYDKVTVGMTVSEVEGILGKGTETSGVAGAVGSLTGSARVMTWGNEKKSITITFANDKVVGKIEKGL
jgi:hypothetical protein